MRLYPSLASCDPLRLAQCIDQLEGWPHLHFDIEDGNFTPNLTFGLKTLRAAAAYVAPRRLDVHMMVTHPLDYLPALAAAGVESVCAHLEALRFPLAFLGEARKLGMEAGLALNIGTPWEAVRPFLPQLDRLLIMTAEPDGMGEGLNAYALEKAMAASQALPVPVYADGGLNRDALARLNEAGCAGCVLGRLVFQAENPRTILHELHSQLSSPNQ